MQQRVCGTTTRPRSRRGWSKTISRVSGGGRLGVFVMRTANSCDKGVWCGGMHFLTGKKSQNFGFKVQDGIGCRVRLDKYTCACCCRIQACLTSTSVSRARILPLTENGPDGLSVTLDYSGVDANILYSVCIILYHAVLLPPLNLAMSLTYILRPTDPDATYVCFIFRTSGTREVG